MRIASFSAPGVDDFTLSPEDAGPDNTTIDTEILLDRRVTDQTTGVSSAFASGATTWTLPYQVATDGSQGTLQVIRTGRADVFGIPFATVTRPAANQVRAAGGDFTDMAVVIGVQYTMRSQLSTLYPRRQDRTGVELAETQGRLQLRYGFLRFEDSVAFGVEVTPPGRSTFTYAFEAEDLTEPESGDFHTPLLAQNKNLIVTITNDSPLGCRIVGFDWEGEYHTRSRRI